jgi:pimeloyl-ACP methyl ester carboxylesterase
VTARALLAAGLARVYRILPRAAGYVHTAMFVDTRGLGIVPDDVCPLGARRVEVTGVPRVAAVYVWGSAEPTVLALHGWGTDSTTMSAVVDVAVRSGESVVCFDAPGHGVSPGTQATITEYAGAISAVLQRFSSVHTIVAHSLSSIAAVAAVSEADAPPIRTILLLAPTCSLAGVLDRWAVGRGLPAGVASLISHELERRDGVPVAHWDIRTLALPTSIQVRIVHDPADKSVPIGDSHQIAVATGADIHETVEATGHHGILGCDETRAALAACLRPMAETPNRKATRCR